MAQVEHDPVSGRVIHEPGDAPGERLDAYLARRLPEFNWDAADWYIECDAGRVQVRDCINPNTGTYSAEKWFIVYYRCGLTQHLDLAPGERPRMRNGFCFIVRE